MNPRMTPSSFAQTTARSLIGEIGTDQQVVFLESGSQPIVSDEDAEYSVPTGLEYLSVPPVSYVLIQLAIAAAVFCFARSPIFGLPRQEQRSHYSDFGKHVRALGELLSRSGDVGFARAQIQHFHENGFAESHGLRRAPSHRPSSSSPPPVDRNPFDFPDQPQP